MIARIYLMKFRIMTTKKILLGLNEALEASQFDD